MFDTLVGKGFEIAPTHITVFGATARWSDDHGWEQNFTGWQRFGASKKFHPLNYFGVDIHLEDCIVAAGNGGVIHLVEKLLVSPPVAAIMYVENILTAEDFVKISYARPCFFDLPAVRFGDVRTPIPVRVAQNPGHEYGCGVVTARGMRV